MAVLLDRGCLDLMDGGRSLRARLRPATAVAGVVVAVLLAGCGSDGGSEPVSATGTGETPRSTGPTRGGSPSETPGAEEPPFPDRVRPRTGRSSGELIVLTDVRSSEHQGFDRVVLEFSGTGTPGWGVRYVDEAVLEGSGDVVGLGGASTLGIVASNTTVPAPDYYSGPRRLEAEDGGAPEVYVAGTFEGYTQVFAGIDGPRAPFRVFALTQPSRLVVDVVDDVG